MEVGGKEWDLDGKDKLDTNTSSVDYDASRKEFIIINKDGTTEAFKIHEATSGPQTQERIGDLIITDVNDILIIQEMKAKGITMSKSNGRSGGIDIKK